MRKEWMSVHFRDTIGANCSQGNPFRQKKMPSLSENQNRRVVHLLPKLKMGAAAGSSQWGASNTCCFNVVKGTSGTGPALTKPRGTVVVLIPHVIFRRLRDSVLVIWVVEVFLFSQTSEIPPQSLLEEKPGKNTTSVSVTMEVARVSFVPSDVISLPVPFLTNPWVEYVVTGVTNTGDRDAETSHALSRANSGSSTSSESHTLTLRPEENTSDNETGNGSRRNPYLFVGARVTGGNGDVPAEHRDFELLSLLVACVESISSKNISAVTHFLSRLGELATTVNWVVGVLLFSQTSEIPPQSLLEVTEKSGKNTPSVSVTMEAARISFVPSDVIGVTNKKDAKTSHALTKAYSGSSTSSESRSLTLKPEETTYDNKTGNGSGRNSYRFEGASVVREAIAEGHGEVGHKELMHISKVLKAMRDSYSSRPAIFAMSNPAKNGNRKIGHVNQTNNMYLFPGIGLGTLLSGDRAISDGILQAASECLASYRANEEIKNEILYPSFQSSRHITEVGVAVVQEAYGVVGPKELRHMSKVRPHVLLVLSGTFADAFIHSNMRENTVFASGCPFEHADLGVRH